MLSDNFGVHCLAVGYSGKFFLFSSGENRIKAINISCNRNTLPSVIELNKVTKIVCSKPGIITIFNDEDKFSEISFELILDNKGKEISSKLDSISLDHYITGYTNDVVLFLSKEANVKHKIL